MFVAYGRIATLGKKCANRANYSQSDHHYNGADDAALYHSRDRECGVSGVAALSPAGDCTTGNSSPL